MLSPVAYGGEPETLPGLLHVIENLAKADGATAWIVSQTASAQLIFAHFPATTMDRIYAEGPDVFGAGAVAPKGRTVPHELGWRVTGRWPFVSGCGRASWIYMNTVVVEGRKLQSLPNGMPATRMALLPAKDVEILETWDVSGLRGTASHDIQVSGAVCPQDSCVPMPDCHPSVNDTIFKISFFDQGGLYIAAVAAGIAAGAMDEVAALAAGGKRPSFSSQLLAASPLFQDRLGSAYLDLEAARALLFQQAQKAWDAAVRGDSLPVFDRALMRATTATVVASAAIVVETAYKLAGGSAVYASSPLQRRLRDSLTATQHTYAGRYNFSLVGALLAGQTIDETFF